jgi:hypothetical protein
VGVGSKEFVEGILEKLGPKAKGREVQDEAGKFALREEGKAYLRVFGIKNEDLRQ